MNRQPNGKRPFASKGTPRRPSAPRESTGLSTGARRLALEVLTDVHRNGAYASLALGERLRNARLSPADRRLATGIVYGALENELAIDWALDRLMNHPTREPVQRDILRLSAYQILFLDRVPDSAAVNEAVNLVKAMGMTQAAGFVNATLRNLSRGKADIPWPKREDGLREFLNVRGSMPLWLVDRLIQAYGEAEAERVVLYREPEPWLVLRPNMTRMSDAEFEALLSSRPWQVERGAVAHAWRVRGAADIALDEAYRKGLFSVQGQSSMLAAEALDVKPGMKVLDACAAPGGKAAYLCERMQLTGRVFAWELHEKRAHLLESMRRRLGLDNLRVTVRDASVYRPDLDRSLDAILLDAPCSGTGVMAQKPDLKLRLKPEDVTAMAQTQAQLLETLCHYLRVGGALVYSTCSLLPEENAGQVEAFLSRHPEYVMDALPQGVPESLRNRQTAFGLQILPGQEGLEGFFIAKMRRVR